MKLRLIAAVSAAAMMVGLAAMPAYAEKTEVGAFQGVANVGTSFVDAEGDPATCTQQGDVTATGKGLYLPTLNPSRPATGTYSLHTNILSQPNGAGTLDVCGFLRGSNGQPNCGSSEGRNGRGKIRWDSKSTLVYLLTGVGWMQSAGGTLAVTGEVQEAVRSTKVHTDKSEGMLVAVVQAQGNIACTAGKPAQGAQQFNVVGTFTATNAA